MDQAFVPEKTSKLVVRVKMDASSNPRDSIDQESETELNPVAVAILAVIILALLGSGYYFFLSSNETIVPAEFDTEKLATEIAISEPSTVAAPIVVEPDITKAMPMVEAEPKLVKVETPESALAVMPKEPVLIEEKVVNTESTLANAETPKSELEVPPKEVDLVEEKVVSTEPEKQVEAAPIIEKDPEPVVAPIVDFSVNVKRAQFTNDIEKREPIDLVDGIVPAKAEGLRRIYFFSELMKLKGQTIRHQWLHEGKLASEIKFDVRGNRWRVNSSKRLNPAAMGNWQVNIVNEAGDILASKRFEYKLID